MTLEEILNLVTHELQLSPDESSQLKHYFSELVSYRLLTHLHGHLTAAQQDHIRQLFTQAPPFHPDLISPLSFKSPSHSSRRRARRPRRCSRRCGGVWPPIFSAAFIAPDTAAVAAS